MMAPPTLQRRCRDFLHKRTGLFVPKQKNERTVILKAHGQTIILNLGRDGKLQARTSSWEDPKVFRDGDRLDRPCSTGMGADPYRPRACGAASAVTAAPHYFPDRVKRCCVTLSHYL